MTTIHKSDYLTPDTAWAAFRAAAGVFGGAAPAYLPDPAPADIGALVQTLQLAVREAEEENTGQVAVAAFELSVWPHGGEVRYGSGRTQAAYRWHEPSGDAWWSVTAPDADRVLDPESMAESMAARVAAGRAAEAARD